MALTAPEGATQSICPSVICQGLLPLRAESAGESGNRVGGTRSAPSLPAAGREMGGFAISSTVSAALNPRSCRVLPVSDIYNAWTHFWLSPNSETRCCGIQWTGSGMPPRPERPAQSEVDNLNRRGSGRVLRARNTQGQREWRRLRASRRGTAQRVQSLGSGQWNPCEDKQ